MLPPSNTLRMQNISVTTTMLEIYCERQQYVNMRESMTKLFFWTTSKAYLNAVIFREATQLTSIGLFIFGENFMEGLPQGGVGSLRRRWVKPREPPYLRHALFFRYLYSVLHFFSYKFLGLLSSFLHDYSLEAQHTISICHTNQDDVPVMKSGTLSQKYLCCEIPSQVLQHNRKTLILKNEKMATRIVPTCNITPPGCVTSLLACPLAFRLQVPGCSPACAFKTN